MAQRPGPESYIYQIVNISRLTGRQQQRIRDLTRISLISDFKRPLHEIDYAMEKVSETQTDLQKALGGPLLKRKQTYKESYSVLALRNDKLEAVVPTAVNVSYRLPWALGGIIEEQAKLRLDMGIAHRYRWIGLRSLSPNLRAEKDEVYDPSELSVLDVMGYIALGIRGKRADPRLPALVFPYDGEALWKETIASWGLKPELDEENQPVKQSIKFFGEDETVVPVSMEHWVSTPETVEDIQHTIESKTDATRILGAICMPKIA